MKNESTIKNGQPRNVWIQLFIGLLGLQAIAELAIGGMLLFNFPTALESGFGIPYNSELDMLGMALGLYLLLLTTLLILSIIWTYRSNYSGITIGIIVGAFLFIFGVLSYFQFGDIQAILVDSLRGLLTIIFAYMAGKELKQ